MKKPLPPRLVRIERRSALPPSSDRPVAPSPPEAPLAPLAPAGSESTPALAAVPRAPAQQAFDDGWASMRDGEFATAARAFDRIPALTHDAHAIEDAAFWRGVALARSGDVHAAANVLEAFLRAYPDSNRRGEANVMLGWLLVERGEPAQARERFTAAANDPSPMIRDRAADGLHLLDAPRAPR